ncbi:MAG: 2-keto-4-pentenoate hydratase [Alphaproteobacteria bacterium]
MTPAAAERAARTLLAARRGGYKIAGLPAECRPRDIEDAYRIQDALLALMGEAASGWFLACTSPAMQAAHGLPGPYFGRMLRGAVFDSPATIAVGSSAKGWSVEIELVFRLGRDLPPRAAPYGADEVAAAVSAMIPGLELVDGRFEDMLTVDGPSLVADNGTDGVLVLGAPTVEWQPIHRGDVATRLLVDGEMRSPGSGASVMGDPLNALIWLANELSRRGHALKEGETVNTGNCLARYCFARAGQTVVADCGSLGSATAHLIQ